MPHKSARKTISELQQAYQSIAEDFSETRKHHWPEFEFFSEYIPNDCKLLDLGCGNGRFFGYLKDHQKIIDYTGVDFTKGLLDIAKKKYPQQEFIEQDMTTLDLERKFDRIISVASFHHIPTRALRQKTLRLISKHLEDDGILLLSVWNLWQKKYFMEHVKAWIRSLVSFFRNDPKDLFIPFGKKKIMRYYHAFIPMELKRLLQKSGFTIERSEISRYNYLFVCRKNMLSTRSHPIFATSKELTPRFAKTSTASLTKSLS
jgi:SAM-dependent methyltransferase